ncbi:RNA-binding protein 33-like, partial [Clarias magur]
MLVQRQAGSHPAGVSELPQRPLDPAGLRETRPKRLAVHPMSISMAQSLLHTH